MLHSNPRYRLSARKALHYTWFDSLREPIRECLQFNKHHRTISIVNSDSSFEAIFNKCFLPSIVDPITHQTNQNMTQNLAETTIPSIMLQPHPLPLKQSQPPAIIQNDFNYFQTFVA